MDHSATATKVEQFEFRGNAREYFGIWIVNLLLSIVTLGIYSAWAKVRSRKYFYQHTYVGGRNFDYHATGKQILIGRLIVIVGILVYSVISVLSPFLYFFMFLLLLVLLPYLLVRGMRFNAIMTSWSNVRFRFYGETGGAFLVYVLFPLSAAFTLYLGWPFADRAIKTYSINNHSLGQSWFHFQANIASFYKPFLIALVWFVIVAGIGVWIFLENTHMIGGYVLEEEDHIGDFIVFILLYLVLLLGFLPAALIYNAFIRNVVFNNTVLRKNNRFHSNISVKQYLWIIISNAVVTVVTLGFMLPWAQVRIASYLAQHTALLPDGSLDDFIGAVGATEHAVGDAYVDIEGIDVGLPI